MNWGMQANKGEGYEFFILAVAIGIALTKLGGGSLSIDSALSKKEP
jgi:hypothetical protein